MHMKAEQLYLPQWALFSIQSEVINNETKPVQGEQTADANKLKIITSLLQ